MSRDPKCNSTEQAPFMEEWKARRERMRLRSSSSSFVGGKSIDMQIQQEVDGHTHSWTSHFSHEHEKDTGVKANAASIKVQTLVAAEVEAHEPVISKTKEKKGSPQKKHRTQIEKRKLREKRRPTGVVNMFPSEDPDENEDVTENDEHKDQEVFIHNQELRISGGTGINRTDVHPVSPAPDNRIQDSQSWMEELQKTVSGKRQENLILTMQLNDKEESLLELYKEKNSLSQEEIEAMRS
ncbi:PRKC apoptosis WT1 regulator protein-like isoform X2 [Hyperolius riggenbachi]|uniref:PRKC apoptosis WT1 regulator protein-like isoform X2 n=1 Tax=Hyperolius riggenbachi TaxID=752182 RepID=UPI0035A37FE9